MIKYLSNNAPWPKIISASYFALAKLNAKIESVVQKVPA